MAQLSLGQVVPKVEITEVSNGKNIKFTTVTQETDTTIIDGKDGVDGNDGFSPVVTMSTTTSSLTISVQDVEGTKTQSVEKGTAVYYQSNEPTSDDAVVWIS